VLSAYEDGAHELEDAALLERAQELNRMLFSRAFPYPHGTAACPVMGILPTTGQGHVGIEPLPCLPPLCVTPCAAPGCAHHGARLQRLARDVQCLWVDKEQSARQSPPRL
jgi:hypothetical protein